MSEVETALCLIRGAIAGLPEADQARVRDIVAQLRAIVAEHGEHGLAALALLGAEQAAKGA